MDPMMFMQLMTAGANLGSSILDKTGKKKNQPLQAGVEFNATPQDTDMGMLDAGLEGEDSNKLFADLFKSYMGRSKQVQMPYQMPELAPLPTSGIQMPNYGAPPVPTYNRRR